MFWRKKKKQKVVKAERFVLQDSNGQERACLGFDGDDNTVIHFMDDNGKTRLYVGITKDSTPRIGLTYADGKGSIQLEANDDLKSAALIIVGAKGKAQVLLGVAQNGHPAIALCDENGKQVYPPPQDEPSVEYNDDMQGFDWDDILRE